MSSISQAPCAPLAAGSLFVAVVAAIPLIAQAQVQLDPVVVTATREAQSLNLSSADIVLIDAAHIRDSSARTLEDLLRQQAGVQLSRNGGPGQSASVLIRGAGAGSTVVLIDGVRVGSATLGQTALEAIELAQVDRIEVLRGPASSLYGADAIGGVVQIFTRRGQPGSRLTAHLAAGGYGSTQADASLSGASGPFDYVLGASRQRSDGVSSLRPLDQFGNFNPDRDGYRRDAGQLGVGLTPIAGHRIGLQLLESTNDARYDASEFNPPTFAQDSSPDFRSRIRSRVSALDYRGQHSSRWTSSVRLARSDDDSSAGATTIDRFVTQRDQASWQNALNVGVGQQVVIALERLLERVDGTPFATPRKRDNSALVLGYSGQFGAHGLQLDLRHDDNSAHGTVGTGRIGYSVEIARGLRLRALAGSSFRAPTFNDLYFPGYGVASVEPERGRSVEAGLNWTQRDSEAALTIYRNRVSQLIAYQPDRGACPPDPAYDFGCAANINRATLSGANLGVAQRWGALRLRANLDLLDATDGRTGARLNRRAAHQESISADYGPGGTWSVGATVLGLGARPDGGATLARETTLDLRAHWRIGRQWRAEARLLNATDRDVQPVRDYQGLGRQGWLGLRYDAQGL